MKCPKCRRKMTFDKEEKDYYCEKCEKYLKVLKKSQDGSGDSDDSDKDAKVDEKNGKEKEPEKDKAPESGTLGGIKYLMIGSVVLLISMIVPWCQLTAILGMILLVLGFVLMYRDRKKVSIDHQKAMKFALVLFIIWLILNIALSVLSYFFVVHFEGELSEYDDSDIVPEDTVIEYIRYSRVYPLLLPVSVSFFALARFLTIKHLIPPKSRKVLTITVILLVISGFLNLYVSTDLSNQVVDNLEDNSKEEFLNSIATYQTLNYNESNVSQESQALFLGTLFVNTGSELFLLLCYYWTYSYQRKKEILMNKFFPK